MDAGFILETRVGRASGRFYTKGRGEAGLCWASNVNAMDGGFYVVRCSERGR
jgi:hypothetical protein